MKDLMVRRVLKDNKDPGTSTGTRATEAPGLDIGSAAGFLGESQDGLCERPGACLDQGGLNRKNFSKSKREDRGTQQLVRELSAAAVAYCFPNASAPVWETVPSVGNVAQPPLGKPVGSKVGGQDPHPWDRSSSGKSGLHCT